MIYLKLILNKRLSTQDLRHLVLTGHHGVGHSYKCERLIHYKDHAYAGRRDFYRSKGSKLVPSDNE